MKPVNLLPEKSRPRAATGERQGSSYVLLGVLGALLLALVVYVLTLNSINSGRDKVVSAQAETARDTALASQLAPYAAFAQVKQQRLSSVSKLASDRFDFERLVRELARVLPQTVWLTNVQAAAAGQSAAGGTSSSTSAVAGGPSLTLQGCAPSQAEVAVALVRLRELQGASDVELQQSAKQPDPASGAGAAAGSPANSTSSVAGGSAGGCGLTHGHSAYSFQVNVTFSPAPTPTTAPAELGGGS